MFSYPFNFIEPPIFIKTSKNHYYYHICEKLTSTNILLSYRSYLNICNDTKDNDISICKTYAKVFYLYVSL